MFEWPKIRIRVVGKTAGNDRREAEDLQDKVHGTSSLPSNQFVFFLIPGWLTWV
jgi:hypothetical protein